MKIDYDRLYEAKPNWLPGDDVPDEFKSYERPAPAPDGAAAESSEIKFLRALLGPSQKELDAERAERTRRAKRDIYRRETTQGTPVAPSRFFIPDVSLEPDTKGIYDAERPRRRVRPNSPFTYYFDGRLVTAQEYRDALSMAEGDGMPRQIHYDGDKREYRAEGYATMFGGGRKTHTIGDLTMQISANTTNLEKALETVKGTLGMEMLSRLGVTFGPEVAAALQAAAEQQMEEAKRATWTPKTWNTTVPLEPFDLEEEIAKSRQQFDETIAAARDFHPDEEYTIVSYDELGSFTEAEFEKIRSRLEGWHRASSVEEVNPDEYEQWVFGPNLMQPEMPSPIVPGSLRLTFVDGIVEVDGDLYATSDQSEDDVRGYIMERLMDSE